MNEDGSPYQSKERFTCKAQADGFKHLLDDMADCPQDYVSDHGRRANYQWRGRFPWSGTDLPGEEDRSWPQPLHLQDEYGHLSQGTNIGSTNIIMTYSPL